MTNKIIYSKKFLRKLKRIYRKRGKYSFISYKKLEEQLADKINIIKMFLKAYPNLNNNYNLRKIPIDKYIVLYSIERNNVLVNDIIHQKSKLLNNQD